MFSSDLLTLGDRVEFLLPLPGDGADLPWPLLAVLLGHVAARRLLALLVVNRLAAWHVVLNQVRVILGPALGDVLRPANLRPRKVAVLGAKQMECMKSVLNKN